jgi:indole-3-glycerol phosphate synthase
MTVLDDILVRKREEVRTRRAQADDATLEKRLPAEAKKPGVLFSALQATGASGNAIISEVKRASPSVGTIDAKVDAPELAERYSTAGAAAISVLTDGPGFGGSLEDLRQVRDRVKTPLLRKDFVVDRYQLLEARLHGADAVLLIVAALSPKELRTLHEQAHALGLDVLVEVHDEEELPIALDAGALIVGVNNRNLKTFQVSLETSEKLLPRIPAHVKAVAESGVKGPAEVKRLREGGARNFLIGEALVRAQDPSAFLRELLAVR